MRSYHRCRDCGRWGWGYTYWFSEPGLIRSYHFRCFRCWRAMWPTPLLVHRLLCRLHLPHDCAKCRCPRGCLGTLLRTEWEAP